MQLTVVGQFGVNGIPVVNLAEQVYKNGLGTVRSQRPCITESLVRGNRGKTARAMCMRVLLTVVGQFGVHGHFAASLVELVLRSAPETARSQFQVMAGKNAKEKHRKSINVTRIPARCTVLGAFGVLGQPVAKPVEEASENALVLAQTHRPISVGKAVVLRTMKQRTVP